MKFLTPCAALLCLLLPLTLQAQAPGHLNPQHKLEQMATDLKLSDEQRAKVQPILEASYQQRMQVMQAHGMGGGQGRPDQAEMVKIRDEMWRISSETDEQLAAVLTPEQMQQYREQRQQARERMIQHMQQMQHQQQGAPAGQ